MNISLIQSYIALGDPDANFAHLAEQMDKALQQETKPDILVLPEMWNTGYALDQIHELADLNGERTHTFLSTFAKKNQVHVVGGSIAEKVEDRVYNTMYVFNREGRQTAKYSKIHLFCLMEEEKHLTAGVETVTFEMEDGLFAGASICYDIRFPELSRSLALAGAKVLFVPAEWPNPRLHHWRTLLSARAIENQMYVVACNRVGTSGDTTFFGHSMIIDPWGEIVAEGGEDEELISGYLDPELTDSVRQRIPVFEDRNPHLYKLD
ncbi:carbon-nitrogen family hydrolase [Paenibacillus lemnae]|uniref:Carbon-nitrogen family hydrolase n=1 Tax=Paenibacillus lemnae TaxID=1330551 RepID=A0A848MCM3_PAELE|nr:carbon-nitrogen family hydrolase [Paenibacillus lemnae]NMO97989.1 carbon-nitrogen family hydrolase [Paenibacillus lemnae]